jgi:hypothetical protein
MKRSECFPAGERFEMIEHWSGTTFAFCGRPLN